MPDPAEQLARLYSSGFEIQTFERFPRAVGVIRDQCIALLQATPQGMQVMGTPGWRMGEVMGVLFEETITLLDEVQYDGMFSFKYSPRPNTPALAMPDSIPDKEKALRLSILQNRQKEIQVANYRRHIGHTVEAMVEGRNEARGQWIGRTSQHKVLNFTAPAEKTPRIGEYVPVRVTQTFANSLLGELAG